MKPKHGFTISERVDLCNTLMSEMFDVLYVKESVHGVLEPTERVYLLHMMLNAAEQVAPVGCTDRNGVDYRLALAMRCYNNILFGPDKR